MTHHYTADELTGRNHHTPLQSSKVSIWDS